MWLGQIIKIYGGCIHYCNLHFLKREVFSIGFVLSLWLSPAGKNPPQIQGDGNRISLALHCLFLSIFLFIESLLRARCCVGCFPLFLRQHHPRFEFHLFYLVATVAHGEEDFPSFFCFGHLLPLSCLYTTTSQCLGDVKIHVDQAGHELLIVGAGLRVSWDSLYHFSTFM